MSPRAHRPALTLPFLALLSLPPVFAQQQPPLPPATPHTAAEVPLISHYIPTPPAANALPNVKLPETPSRLRAAGLDTYLFGLVGPFHAPSIPPLFPGTGVRFNTLVRNGKLYLTLHDAIALALENNLDIEVERYNLLLSDTDLLRAKGGGSLRGIDYTIQQPPNGVGGPGSPLLNSTATNVNPTTPAVTDLTSLNSTTQAQTNLSTNGQGLTYAPGPSIPLFDPSLIATAGYFRRSNTVSLVSTTGSTTGAGGTGTGSGVTSQPAPLTYVAANIAYLQGFSTGAQLEATVNNDSQVIFATNSQFNPFYSPSTSVTLTQPLLRGRGRNLNLRFIRIANINRKVSRLLFEQQVLDTIYGTSRIYFDLVSLGENIVVKQEALRTAQKLRQDDADQVIQGTLAPIELTRASALVSSSEFDLTQAQGLYQQEEVILRNLLTRSSSPIFSATFSEIVPTDPIVVPDVPEPVDLDALVSQGLVRRPDLAQARLQVQANQANVQASRNQVLPQLNLYGNVETRGSSEASFELLGSPGTGAPNVPQNFALGGRARYHPTPAIAGTHRKTRRPRSRRDRNGTDRVTNCLRRLQGRRHQPHLPGAAPGRRARQAARRPVHQPRRCAEPDLPRPGPVHRDRRPQQLDQGSHRTRPRHRNPARPKQHPARRRDQRHTATLIPTHASSQRKRQKSSQFRVALLRRILLHPVRHPRQVPHRKLTHKLFRPLSRILRQKPVLLAPQQKRRRLDRRKSLPQLPPHPSAPQKRPIPIDHRLQRSRLRSVPLRGLQQLIRKTLWRRRTSQHRTHNPPRLTPP
jgi:outer membrane protein